MSFTHAQATVTAGQVASLTSQQLVLASNPALGDACVFSLGTDGAAPTVQDLNGNVYTKSINSSAANSYWFYLLNAPSNASKTVTASFGTATFAVSSLDDFTVTGGAASFDNDFFAAFPQGPGTTINLPSVNPAGTGELFVAHGAGDNSVTSVNSPWTQGAIGPLGDGYGYILNGSANTPLNMTIVNGNWDGAGIAFKFTPTASPALPGQMGKTIYTMP